MPCAIVRRLKLRLFIEGVEIPCIGAQVQSAPNSPVVASFQIPPLDEAAEFLPRSIIHAFFLDEYDQSPLVKRAGASAQKAQPGPSVFDQAYAQGSSLTEDGDISLTNELVKNSELQKYKLLFVGELMGYQYTKQAMSRSIVLQCQDLSNYWDYAFQFNNTDLFGPGMKAMFSGGATNLFTDFLSEPGGQVVGILMRPPTRYPNMKGLLGGIIHLLEAIGGSYYYGDKYAGQNIFFSLAELRLRITQMITAYDKDPTAKKLLGGGYDSLFGRSIGNLGEQASFRKIISMLSGVIFHEVYGQPCPMFQIGTKGTQSGFVRKKLRDMQRIGSLGSTADQMAAGVSEVKDAMEAFNSADLPGVDQKAVDTAKALGLNAKKYEQAVPKAKAKTTKEHLDKHRVRLRDIIKGCEQGALLAQREVAETKRNGFADVGEMCKRITANFRTASQSLKNAVTTMNSLSSAADGPQKNQLLGHLTKAYDALAKIGNEEASITKAKDAIPAALKQQIFRPDVWFSAPPRCNIIFPNMTMSMMYGTNFMAAPTRLMLKTNDEFFGEDELFDKFYFAPKVPGIKAKSNEANLLKTLLNYDIFEHELYTGILPVFEKMGEFNIFAARSGMVDGKQPKVGLAQRSANFLYFKYRFAARSMSVQTRFNPYIACGFPGLVIDKHVDLAAIKKHNDSLKAEGRPTRDVNKLLGKHHLANFTNVGHNLGQMEGTTSIECSYARIPNERVEFLGAVQDQVAVQVAPTDGKGPQGPVTEVSVVAALSSPKKEQLGPKLGRIMSVRDVTEKYVKQASTDSDAYLTNPVFPLYGGPRDKKTKELRIKVPIAASARAKQFGKEVTDFAGDPELMLTFKAYEIEEQLPKKKEELIDLSPEEYIRPGWYGDCWHPAKISDVYYDFFGTGAITEATQVQNTDGNPFADPFVSSDAQTALTDAVEGGNIPVSTDTMIALSQAKSANIDQAVSFLVLTYSIIKTAGFDADEFMRSYTWRPIASLLDMFGTIDLELDDDGQEVIQGVEGFHSRAFGDKENLFGLVTPNIESVVGIKRGSPIAAKADVRKSRREAALAYIAALKPGTVLLG